MAVHLVLVILRCLCVLAAIVLMGKKVALIRQFKTTQSRYIQTSWLGWYESMLVRGTSSSAKKEFMKRCNAYTTLFWLCIIIGVLLLFIPE